MTNVVVPSSVDVTDRAGLLDSGVGITAPEEDMTGMELLRDGIAGLAEVEGAAELYTVDLVDLTGVGEIGVDETGTEDAPIGPAGTDLEIVSVSVNSDGLATDDKAAIELEVSTDADADQDQDRTSLDVDVDATMADEVTAAEGEITQMLSEKTELVSTGLTLEPRPGTLDSTGGVKELKKPALRLVDDAGQSVTSGLQLVTVTSFVENTVASEGEGEGKAGVDQLDANTESELVSTGTGVTGVLGAMLDSAAAELRTPILTDSVDKGVVVDDAGQYGISGPQLVIVTSFVENTVESTGGEATSLGVKALELVSTGTGVAGVLGATLDSAAAEVGAPTITLSVEGAAGVQGALDSAAAELGTPALTLPVEDAGQSGFSGPQLVIVTSFVENTVASSDASAPILSRADNPRFESLPDVIRGAVSQ